MGVVVHRHETSGGRELVVLEACGIGNEVAADAAGIGLPREVVEVRAEKAAGRTIDLRREIFHELGEESVVIFRVASAVTISVSLRWLL